MATPSARFPRIYAGRRRRWLQRLVLNGLAQGAAAFVLAHMLQRALTATRAGEAAVWPVVAMAATGLLIWALRVAEAADAERVGQDYVMRVRIRLFDRLMEGRDDHARRRRFGVPMSRMVNDLNALRNWVSVGVARSLVASIMVVVLLVTMATIDAAIAAALAGLVAVAVGVMLVAAPTLRSRVREARRRRGRLANNLGEKLLARETVRQFSRLGRERRRIRRQSDRLAQSLVLRARWAQLLRAAPAALLPIALAALVWLAAGAAIPLESVVVAVLVVGLLTAQLTELARAFDYRLTFEEGRERIGDLLGRARRRPIDEPAASGAWPIEVDAVAVAGRLPISSFVASAGELVCVTGAASKGKSTLVELLAGRLVFDTGQVRIGPVTCRAGEAIDWHGAVQCVSPEVPLLRGTVGSNLDYAGDKAERAETADLRRAVLGACGLLEPASDLENGLDTSVDERGTNLSASLRARVALARAALARPRVLLVDDPVFAVDAAARRALASVHEIVGATLVCVLPEAQLAPSCDRVWQVGGNGDAGRAGKSRGGDRDRPAGGPPLHSVI